MTSPRGRLRRAAAVAMLAAFLGACATQTGTVVLLPQKDGGDAAVSVRQGDKEVVLDKPYAAAKQTTAGPTAYTSSAKEVEASYGPLLSGLPSRPTSTRRSRSSPVCWRTSRATRCPTSSSSGTPTA